MKVIGYPKQDVDAMIEADAAAEWERQNADPEFAEIVSKLEAAKAKISEAIKLLNSAANLMESDDRILSLSNDMEDLETDLGKQIKELGVIA